MPEPIWHETSRCVYSAIYTEHHHELRVWGSVTEDTFVRTVWSLPGAEQPLIKIEDRKKDRMVVGRRCFICIGMKEE